jgi:hypothetical protein
LTQRIAARPRLPEMVKLKPRVYLSGFPKSGLHMVEQAVSVLVSPVTDDNWFGTFKGNAWGGEWCNLDLAFGAFAAIPDGCYAKGHFGYWPTGEQILAGLGMAVLFIYRDLRAVAVSQAHHVISDDEENFKHPAKDLYRALPTFEDVLLACIEGIDEYPGVHDRWQQYAGWLGADWVWKVRFEDMRLRPYITCSEIFRYCMGAAARADGLDEVSMSEEAHLETVAYMVNRVENRKRSVTFRRGSVDGWREHFTPRVKEAFKARDNGWTVALGYEANEEW